MRSVLALAIVIGASSAVAAPGFPKGVQRLARSSGAVASADGTRVAYWADDGRIAIREVDRRREVRHVLPHGAGYGRIQFSPDGTRLAYVRDGWLAIADVATGEERELGRCKDLQFTFDRAGTLHWIDGHQLRREGGRSAIDLPRERMPRDEGGGWRQVTHVLARHVPIANAPVVVSCTGTTAKCDALWVTDARTGSRRELGRRTVRNVVIAPSQDRVCFFEGDALRCAATDGSGTATIATGRDLGDWGHVGHELALPFSPDGQRLVYSRRTDRASSVVVHDLASGRETELALPGPYLDVAFWTADTLLLYEGWFRGRGPALATLTMTGKRETLVVDDTQYTVIVFVPGRRDVLFTGRETHDGGRDFVEVRLKR